MKAITRRTAAVLVALGALGAAHRAAAQTEDQEKEWGDEDAAQKEEEPDKPTGAAEASGETPATDGKAPAPPVDEGDSDTAKESEGFDPSLGVRYRGLLIPQAVLNWFLEGGETVYVHGFGPEFALRDGKTEYILSAWVALYGMGPVAIKGSSDDEFAWEIVESDIKSIYLTADYLGHAPLARGLELSYGGGAGIGILFGKLGRTQATLEPGGTAGDAADYVPCRAVDDPDPSYCDDFNDHYNGYVEPNWFEGGTKPVLFPWLAGQVGLRYQPHEKFVGRLDLGLGISGLFFGVGADYAL
jgi:hypothetical protein